MLVAIDQIFIGRNTQNAWDKWKRDGKPTHRRTKNWKYPSLDKSGDRYICITGGCRILKHQAEGHLMIEAIVQESLPMTNI